MVTLSLGKSVVTIDKGELVGYKVDGYEYIHQKGSPGWRNADTEMFPVIGPTAEAKFKVEVPVGEAIQDQHGLLRELSYDLSSSLETSASFTKKYAANTQVENAKYPEKSTEQWLSWPYNFEFVKTFLLTPKGLEITFTISGDIGMPFMLGYHPAFNLQGKAPVIKANSKEISIPEIKEVGSRAYQLANCTSVTLKDIRVIEITTEGFGHFMLWTEVDNMVCIEPITFYPYAVAATKLHEGFQYVNEVPQVFKVYLEPKDI